MSFVSLSRRRAVFGAGFRAGVAAAASRALSLYFISLVSFDIYIYISKNVSLLLCEWTGEVAVLLRSRERVSQLVYGACFFLERDSVRERERERDARGSEDERASPLVCARSTRDCASLFQKSCRGLSLVCVRGYDFSQDAAVRDRATRGTRR